MKKNFFILALILGMSSLTAFAQYKPTEKDLGKDCATENGKLGTYKQVTITETRTNTNSTGNSYSNSNSGSVTGNASVSAGTKTNNAQVGVSTSVQNSNSNSRSNTNAQSTTTTRTYNDIQCVEDKNANNPQMTPIRW